MAGRDTAPLGGWNVQSRVLSVARSSDGARLVAGTEDGCVRVWHIQTGSLILGPLTGHTGPVRSVAFSPNDICIVSGSDDQTIRVWHARTGNPIGHPLKGHASTVYSVSFFPDNMRIISGSADCTIRIWDLFTGLAIGGPLKGHTDAVHSVTPSPDPDGTLFVSGSRDCTVRLWDTRTGAPVGEPMIGHNRAVNSVAFSSDCAYIVSGSDDHTIRNWDTATRTCIGEPLEGHTDCVRTVEFSPDDARIISGSWDQTIRVWDAASRTLIGEPLGQRAAAVVSVVFSTDGTTCIAGLADQTICLWKVPLGESSFEKASSQMSAQEMFDRLVMHGLTDLSQLINLDRCSSSAIARGGFGDVWRGELINGVVVAIKCVWLHRTLQGDRKGMKRAMRELYVWSKSRHQNVQKLMGIIMFGGGLGMVSPWMDHGNLEKYIADNPDVSRYPLCLQLSAGVSYLHSIGMVHGDLKAINVLVSPDGILKINDFDHAILSNTTLRFSTTTNMGGGTLRWMAPELIQDDDDNDDEGNTKPTLSRNKKTDVYALGMTMLETITGRIPYAEFHNDMAIYKAIDNQRPPERPIELPTIDDRANQMWELLVQCWSHDPSMRPEAWCIFSYLQGLPYDPTHAPGLGIAGRG